MDHIESRRALLHRLAFWCAALVLVITSLSSFIRLSQAGLGCDPWPACYGLALQQTPIQAADPAGDGMGVQIARLVHRVIATVVLLGVVMMVALCFSGGPRMRREGALVLVLLVLTLGLTVLGRWTAGSRIPAVAMGNLTGGMLMFALCARLAARSVSAGRHQPLARRTLAVVGTALLLGQLALGALTSTSYAGLSCTGAIDCLQSAAAAGWQWQMLDPWRVPAFDAGVAPVNGVAALTQLVHRGGALATVLVLVPLGLLSLHGRNGGTLLLLLALQVLAGVLMVASGLALPLALAHNLIAALLLAVVVRMI